LEGGRKDVKHEFVDSDLQVIEDLGLRQRVFSISGTVAAQRDAAGAVVRSYQDVRDALLRALESGGPGVLVHPFLGRLENIVARTYSFRESTTQLGDSPIDVTFEVSNTDGLPQPEEDVIGGVTTAGAAVTSTAGADLADRFSVTSVFTGNFRDALDKLEAFVDGVAAATDPAAIEASELDEFSRELADFGDSVASLVDDPQDLSDSVLSLFNTMDGLYATPEAVLGSFERLFNYGDGDIPFTQDTAGRIERQRNRSVLNDDLQALALSHAYSAASAVDFPTEEAIDEVADRLEAQFQKIEERGTVTRDILDDLTAQRIAVRDFFDSQKDLKPKVVQIHTSPTSTRLLAFQYYGSSDLGDTIGELNGFAQSAYIEGDVRILTE
ncbi:MAG: DNA circularization N-terminal domain-containing protein, partial [Actinobacteria bacterium]|nr:DNA circularization N-terminal domain-containing protein [Actinomycetota bacterium]